MLSLEKIRTSSQCFIMNKLYQNYQHVKYIIRQVYLFDV